MYKSFSHYWEKNIYTVYKIIKISAQIHQNITILKRYNVNWNLLHNIWLEINRYYTCAEIETQKQEKASAHR